MVMCQLFHEDAEIMLGKVMVHSYFWSIPTLTFWIALILYLLH